MQDPRAAYPRPPFPKHRLKGRRALITGGDSGIGRAAAIAFAREGADVAFGYLPAEEEDAREVVQLIEKEGRKAVPLPGEIRSEEFCKKLVADAASALGGLDILVNNAAYQSAQESIADIGTEQFDSTFKTNVYALFWITKAALPHLKAGATIVNTSSINAYDPSEDLFDYAATKAAISSFTKTLEPFWTPLQPSGGQKPNRLPTFAEESPMGRPGQPAEIAPLYVLLAGSDASFVSGNILSGARRTQQDSDHKWLQ